MNSFEDLKDYMIADEILRIKSLDRESLERELINLKSKQIESLNLDEVMTYLKTKNYGNSK